MWFNLYGRQTVWHKKNLLLKCIFCVLALFWAYIGQPDNSECMGKTFQAAITNTWEIFEHKSLLFFWYLPNWTSTDLWCVALYVRFSTTNQRSVEVQFGSYQKNILQEWSMVKNLSCISCAALNAFPTLQTPSLYRLQGSPCVVILPCKDPVKITGYHSNPSSYVVGT